MRDNHVKRTLRGGGVSMGVMCLEFATTGIGRLSAEAGAEFAVFDMEHTGWSLETIKMLMATSRSRGPRADRPRADDRLPLHRPRAGRRGDGAGHPAGQLGRADPVRDRVRRRTRRGASAAARSPWPTTTTRAAT